MAIVGFGFTKILGERKEPLKVDVKISSNVDIVAIDAEINQALSNNDSLVTFSFEYGVFYGTSAKIELYGTVLYMAESPKDAKKILENWKKSKDITPELSTNVINAILFKCNIRALELEDSVNLPPHLRLPFVGVKNKQEKE